MSAIILNNKHVARETAYVLMGVALLFASSQLSIPLEPVPIVLATVGVMLIAITYNMFRGMTTIITYVAMGAIGAPFFANYSGGMHVLYGPTGGYIIGYILCVYVMNKLKSILDQKTNIGILLNCLCGTVAFYVCGVPWLATHIGIKMAIVSGFLPFIIPGLIKAVMLVFILRCVGYVQIMLKT